MRYNGLSVLILALHTILLHLIILIKQNIVMKYWKMDWAKTLSFFWMFHLFLQKLMWLWLPVIATHSTLNSHRHTLAWCKLWINQLTVISSFFTSRADSSHFDSLASLTRTKHQAVHVEMYCGAEWQPERFVGHKFLCYDLCSHTVDALRSILAHMTGVKF